MADVKGDFKGCSICSVKGLGEISFISHLLGKKHRKKADQRVINESKKGCKLSITGLQDFRKVDLQLTKALLQYSLIDISVVKTRVYVEFATKEEAAKVSREGLRCRGVQLNFSSDAKHPKRKMKTLQDELKMSPWVTEALSIPVSFARDMDKLVYRLVNDLELKPFDLQNREKTRYVLEALLNRIYQNVRVHIFGSSANNLGFRGCDVDLLAHFPPDVWDDGKDGPARAAKLIRTLAKEIRRCRMGYNVVPIPQARVPIVKFTDSMYKLDVDLSFKNGMPVCNTELIKFYTTIHPLVRPYLMILRFWAKVQNISGGGKPTTLLTNYCFCMMMLFWLMLRKNQIVPCVGELQEQLNLTPWKNTVIINGWNCSFSPDVDKWRTAHYQETILDLVWEFFDFYSLLDAKEWAISPLAGALIKKKDLLNRQSVTKVPRYLETFFFHGILIQAKSPLCVQDPFEWKHNIASGLKESPLIVFQLKCKKAKDICKAIKEGKAPLVSLFEEIDVEVDFDEQSLVEENTQSNDTEVVDEALSVSSNDSIELLQELESLERSGGLQEISNAKPTTKIAVGETEQPVKSKNNLPSTSSSLFELSDEEREALRESLYGCTKQLSPVIVELNGASSSDEEITVLQEIQTEEEPNECVEVIDLEEASTSARTEKDTSTKRTIIFADISSSSERTEEEDTSRTEKDTSTKRTVIFADIEEEDSHTDHVSSNLAENSPSIGKELSIAVLPPAEHSSFRFNFDFNVDKFFEILPDGSLKFERGKAVNDVCTDSSVSEFWVFILKSILKCEVEVKDVQVSPDIQIKRKNVEFEEQAPAKYFKEATGKSGHIVIATYTSRTTFKVWEGRKKVLKNLVNKSVLSPLQSEVIITDLVTRGRCPEFSIHFETTLLKETNKPDVFWVDSKCRSLNPKVVNTFNTFFTFFAKLTRNLASQVRTFIQ